MGEIYRSGYTGAEVDATLANSISHVATTSGNPHGTTASDVGAVATDAGALIHKGSWDASTNFPTLANGTGTKDDFYHVLVAGSQDFGAGSISFNLGELVIYDGTVWSKLGIDAYTKAEADSLLSNKQNAKPDGTNLLIKDSKIAGQYLPDYLLGQVMYGGNLAGSVATLTLNAKTKLGITDATITLTNDDTAITGYVANNGIYYIATEDSSFASLEIKTGDWLISTGASWTKVDNSDCVSGVKGDNETVYRTGNINITKDNIGLGNVDNTSDDDKPVSNATQTALGNKVDKVNGKGLSTNDYTTDEKDKLEGIAAGAQINTITGIKGNSESDYRTGNVNITKDNIGLGNVDNTSDANKPVSEAMLTALNGKSNTDHTHNYAGSSTPGGVATSSTKLETARSIFGQSFNGTTNIDYPEVDGNLDTAGWYRVFTKDHMTTYGASLVFAVNTVYHNHPASSAIVIVNDSGSSPAITTICSSYTSAIPKVRAVWRNGYVCYIDIYYNVSVSNRVKITQLASAGSYSYDWTIAPTLSVAPEVPSGYSANEQSLHSNAITSTNFNAENFIGSGAGLTGVTSAQVSYSNTSSGMAAETVQAALDELCTVSARTSVTALMIPHGRSAILTMPTVPVCCGEIATASNSSANVCSTHLFYGLRTETPKLTTIDSCTLIAVAASAGAITITNSATTVDAYCYITHKTSAHATIELVPEGGT